ncbi:MAG: protein kinase [Pseudonocardiaceae bacterium]|nr:protein kinase [Pseudonocardiaceae bacterium]
MASDWQLDGYTQVRQLGSGASGRVVHAVHDATGTPVAIKYVSAQLFGDQEFRARFRGEAQLLAGLADANVVRFYQYVESTHGAAIVMELVDGVTLRRLLDSHGAMEPEAALVLLKGSLLGLTAAHAAGVVHRDYKPANVLVSADGASKLTDFGIAVPTGAQVAAEGSPAYLAPEQWFGAPASPSADVYAATVVCFECLTGHRPFRQENLTALARAHREAPVPVEEVPESLRELVSEGLAKDPATRPPSATAFLGDLESAAVAGYGPEWESRGRRRLAALAALLAAFFPFAHAPGANAPGLGAPAPEPPDALTPGKIRLPKRRSVLITSGAIVTAAVIVGSVLIANSGSESPGASDAPLPTRPPDDPGSTKVIIIEQAEKARTASFSYELNGCCAQQFHGEGRLDYRKSRSTAEITDYYNIPGMRRGSTESKLRGFVFHDTTYVADGNSWQRVPTRDVDMPPDQRTNQGDAHLAAGQLVDVRNAARVERIAELLDDATELAVSERGNTISYRGSVPPENPRPGGPDNPFRELGIDFELTLGKDYLPKKLHEVYKYSLMAGDNSKQLTDISYSGWGAGAAIKPPRS